MELITMTFLVFLFCITCKTYAMNCSIPDDPLPLHHQFAQAGNVIFGTIVSQAFFFHNSSSFIEDPSRTLINELAYGTFSLVHGGKNIFPSLYQMVPNEMHQYTGLIQLLLHFGWNWIGILAMDDDYGDMFLQKIEPLLSQNNICYAFIIRTPRKAFLEEYIKLITMELRYDQLFLDKVKVLPLSLCNDHCYPGSSRKKKEGEKFCCYGCVPCSEGQISDEIALPSQKIPLLAYGTFSSVHGEKNVFPSLYQMVPNEMHQYTGIIRLLQYFGWNWIGILTVDDDYGDMFLRKIEPLLSQNSICYAFILRTPPKAYLDEYIHLISMELRYDQLFMDKVKPGNVILGMITSQAFFFHNSPSFTEDPSQTLINEVIILDGYGLGSWL
ncbi:hypothetical protein E2320_003002 [Naja naja]|nr:hypothetical protein E2320_003002 [Naja naja]